MSWLSVFHVPAQVIQGGENLLDKVAALEAQAAKADAELAERRVRGRAQEAQLAELQSIAADLEQRYSSEQV